MNRYINLADIRDHNNRVVKNAFICGLASGLVLALAMATVLMVIGL